MYILHNETTVNIPNTFDKTIEICGIWYTCKNNNKHKQDKRVYNGFFGKPKPCL